MTIKFIVTYLFESNKMQKGDINTQCKLMYAV